MTVPNGAPTHCAGCGGPLLYDELMECACQNEDCGLFDEWFLPLESAPDDGQVASQWLRLYIEVNGRLKKGDDDVVDNAGIERGIERGHRRPRIGPPEQDGGQVG